MWMLLTVNIPLLTFPRGGEAWLLDYLPTSSLFLHHNPWKLTRIKMKVVGSTCALKSKVGGEDMVRCLSEQSLTIAKCKIPLLDEQMSVFLQDMNNCYSKLKELVPTLPTNKKASKVEILQHVIDYIWDLQVELDEPEKSRQLTASGVARTPLTTLNAELASIAVENGCSDDRIMCR
ncbi:DNA-binding protein inhibitor ID-1 [Hippoglossus hippoglossus]|uniref:DNA-binding protein inhibitor ID-1 n=1 Tax=Hippoglossus hippoglossus TaxID=8267 RepID=UPI00148DCCF5|nr:DNA-binding protein inhibitor ID-1 [Hippoglossus hippoglossus]XP_035007144.1 DNA-binding protein inhibitor ID-1 [Hippoglossus stenolepis]